MTPKVQYQKGVTAEVNKTYMLAENAYRWCIWLTEGALQNDDKDLRQAAIGARNRMEGLLKELTGEK